MKKSEIWPRFLTSVAFELHSFRNEATYQKSLTVGCIDNRPSMWCPPQIWCSMVYALWGIWIGIHPIKTGGEKVLKSIMLRTVRLRQFWHYMLHCASSKSASWLKPRTTGPTGGLKLQCISVASFS